MAVLSVSGNEMALSGPVDFFTATALEEKGISFITRTTSRELNVDLNGITRGDSSALALMLSWKRVAIARQITITFSGWSDELLRLAKLCNTDGLLTSA